MNEAKHTPGPWFYDKEEDGGHDTIRSTKADILGFTGVISGGRDGDLVGNEADLVLAAAAPELLEELQAMAGIINRMGDMSDQLISPMAWRALDCEAKLTSARAALAKATGTN